MTMDDKLQSLEDLRMSSIFFLERVMNDGLKPYILQEYLQATSISDLTYTNRLIYLASQISADTSFEGRWNTLNFIYKFAIELAVDVDEIKALYGLLVTNGLSILEEASLTPETLDFKVTMANQLEAILTEEPLQFPEAWRLEMMGMLFLKHPLRSDMKQNFLIKAKDNFQNALKISVRSQSPSEEIFS